MRISAQSGAFIIYGLNPNRKDSKTQNFMSRIENILQDELTSNPLDVDSSQKSILLEELSAVGINEYTVYPELDKIAGFIKTKYWNR